MKEHEHQTKNKPETKPAQYEVAKKAYAHGLEAEAQLQHAGYHHPDHHDHQDHHAHMAADFRKRFFISMVLTLPILVFSPLLLSASTVRLWLSTRDCCD